jgi:hypothetical protein
MLKEIIGDPSQEDYDLWSHPYMLERIERAVNMFACQDGQEIFDFVMQAGERRIRADYLRSYLTEVGMW